MLEVADGWKYYFKNEAITIPTIQYREGAGPCEEIENEIRR